MPSLFGTSPTPGMLPGGTFPGPAPAPPVKPGTPFGSMLGLPSPSSDWQAAAANAARTTLAPRTPCPAPRPRRRAPRLGTEGVRDDDRGALLTPVIHLPVGLKGSRGWLDWSRVSHRRSHRKLELVAA